MLLLLPLFALTACSTNGGTGGGSYNAALVQSIAIEPTEVTLDTSPTAVATQAFVVNATFDDGTVAPLENDLISWETSNQSAGTLGEDGVFTSASTNGGFTTITATHNGISATAAVTIIYREEMVDGDGPPASDFGGTAAGTLGWVYPPEGVAVPRNVPSLSFMCEDKAGAEGYLFHFTTPTTDISVTSTEHRWTASGDQWVKIAAANSDGDVVVTCSALAGGQVYTSSPLNIHVDRMDALGSIYYWSTTDEGVVKVPFSASDGELYYAPATGSGQCVGCHVVGEDRMAVSYGNFDGEFFVGVTDISGEEPVELANKDTLGQFTTMDPSGSIMLSTTAWGDLNVWDARTGAYKGVADSGGKFLSMPQWSPMGDKLVVVDAREMSECDFCFGYGKIAVADISADGMTISNFVTVYDPGFASNPDEQMNSYYPAWSPDAEWIAFNVGLGNPYDNETGDLYVVSAEGGTDAVALTNANIDGDIANSWPHWGPLPDDDVYWLTFSSKRPYGDQITDGRPQIWVASFSSEKAIAGDDPSTPAFWLSNQDPETSNHSTYWGP